MGMLRAAWRTAIVLAVLFSVAPFAFAGPRINLMLAPAMGPREAVMIVEDLGLDPRDKDIAALIDEVVDRSAESATARHLLANDVAELAAMAATADQSEESGKLVEAMFKARQQCEESLLRAENRFFDALSLRDDVDPTALVRAKFQRERARAAAAHCKRPEATVNLPAILDALLRELDSQTPEAPDAPDAPGKSALPPETQAAIDDLMVAHMQEAIIRSRERMECKFRSILVAASIEAAGGRLNDERYFAAVRRDGEAEGDLIELNQRTLSQLTALLPADVSARLSALLVEAAFPTLRSDALGCAEALEKLAVSMQPGDQTDAAAIEHAQGMLRDAASALRSSIEPSVRELRELHSQECQRFAETARAGGSRAKKREAREAQLTTMIMRQHLSALDRLLADDRLMAVRSELGAQKDRCIRAAKGLPQGESVVESLGLKPKAPPAADELRPQRIF